MTANLVSQIGTVAGVRADVTFVFTPTLTFGGLSTGVVYTSQRGYIIATISRPKPLVGSVVNYSYRVYVNVTTSSVGTATGNAAIGGIPLALSTAASETVTSRFKVAYSGINPQSTAQQVDVTVPYQTTSTPTPWLAPLVYVATNGSTVALPNTSFSNTCQVFSVLEIFSTTDPHTLTIGA